MLQGKESEENADADRSRIEWAQTLENQLPAVTKVFCNFNPNFLHTIDFPFLLSSPELNHLQTQFSLCIYVCVFCFQPFQ